jgi:DNA-binding response OmpR family regulator
MPGKILVVDDDPDILDAITMILESQGYQVSTARDGIEGLATLKAENPDLMILDLMMPKMDGFAVCKELQDLGKRGSQPAALRAGDRTRAGRR